jgi:hypothetical protein
MRAWKVRGHVGVESAWKVRGKLRGWKVAESCGGKGLRKVNGKLRGVVGIETIDSLKSLNIARKARRQLNVF